MKQTDSARAGSPFKIMLRAVVSLLVLALIARSVDPGHAWDVLQRARWDLLALALLMQFGSTAIAAYRWQLIMRNLKFGQTFSFYFRSYFKGMFFNQALPASIGGDAVRVLDMAGRGFRKRDALYGVMVDRVTGLGALISLSLLAYLVRPDLLPAKVYYAILAIFAAGAIGFSGLLLLSRTRWLDHNPRLALLKSISTRLPQAFSAHRLQLLVSSLLIPLFALLGFFATGWALGLRYDLTTYFAIVPPAIVLTIIPVSIAGWGVREGALVGLFSLIGANKTTVLMMSLLYGLALIVVSLPGLVIFLKGHQRRPAKA
ncbi:MAG TPA: lysylphosphatidylglycerol synthase transmembrane domain-containing protein [Methylophilaceae bacterium]|nr:lysylphosphatidylglycerol synthase transmembrane domain-containing protein [Methylophilaceae bacterium]